MLTQETRVNVRSVSYFEDRIMNMRLSDETIHSGILI